MTPIYSGGLIYEYSFEKVIIPSTGAAFGIVNISGNTVKERPDFTALQTAFKKTPIPSDNGGYSPNNKASSCPPESPHWKANASLPAIPQGATKYMTQGAGPGPGFTSNPDGSQWKGTSSTGSWTPIAAGSVSNGNSSTPSGSSKKSAAQSIPLPNFAYILLGMALLYKI
jgi:1,3-beta-glucanosyltransferase GAS5